MSRIHDCQCEVTASNVICNCIGRRRDAERDAANFRAELRDRLDRCTDSDHGAAFGWLADNHPDLVREALDETGAPE